MNKWFWPSNSHGLYGSKWSYVGITVPFLKWFKGPSAGNHGLTIKCGQPAFFSLTMSIESQYANCIFNKFLGTCISIHVVTTCKYQGYHTLSSFLHHKLTTSPAKLAWNRLIIQVNLKMAESRPLHPGPTASRSQCDLHGSFRPSLAQRELCLLDQWIGSLACSSYRKRMETAKVISTTQGLVGDFNQSKTDIHFKGDHTWCTWCRWHFWKKKNGNYHVYHVSGRLL